MVKSAIKLGLHGDLNDDHGMIMTAIIQQLYSRHFHEVWFKFSYSCDLTIFLQLSLLLWIKAFLCILVLVVS